MDARPSPDRLSQILDSVEKISRFCVVGNSSVNLRNEWLISSTHCVLPAKFGIFPFIFPNKRELVRRPVRIRLRTPPSSLRKPPISDTTPNRAFLRGFPAAPFPDFGLYERSRILGVVFGPLSPHLEIPFPAQQQRRPRRALATRVRRRPRLRPG